MKRSMLSSLGKMPATSARILSQPRPSARRAFGKGAITLLRSSWTSEMTRFTLRRPHRDFGNLNRIARSAAHP